MAADAFGLKTFGIHRGRVRVQQEIGRGTNHADQRMGSQMRHLLLPLLLLSVQCKSADPDSVPPSRQLAYPNLSFTDGYRSAVKAQIHSVTAYATYYLYCPEVNSFLGYQARPQKYLGRLSVNYSRIPRSIDELFDADGKEFIHRCEQRLLARAGMKAHEPPHGALARLAQQGAQAQIDGAAAILAAALSSDTAACVPNKGKDQCLGLRGQNDRVSIVQVIESEDETSKAKLAVYVTAVLALFRQQDVVLNFGGNELTNRVVIFADTTAEALRSIAEVDTIVKRRETAHKLAREERDAKAVAALRKQQAEQQAAAKAQAARDAEKRARLCKKRPCECDDSCEHGPKD